MTDLTNKVAIVTGAARGLGRAYALHLARLGADIAIIDRNLAGAAEFDEALTDESVAAEVRNLGRRAIEIEADLTNPADMIAAHVLAELGRIDILVNNAGGAFTPIERSLPSIVADADIAATFDVNFLSTVHCCKAVIPAMRRQGGGAIVNTASVGARYIVPGGGMAIYGAAKAAVVQYTRSLAAEVGPFGIRANCIASGVIRTARIIASAARRDVGGTFAPENIPLGRHGTAEDCARVVEFLAGGLSAYVTGQCISVCGGAILTPA